MSIQAQGFSGTIAEIDALFRAMRMQARPVDHGTGGQYRNAMRTGTIAAVLAANANIYSFRNPSATMLAAILRIRAQMFANIAFTAAFNDMSMKAHVARSYTTEHTTSGTAATLTGNMGKLKTTMAGSVCQIRTLTTVNAGITGGTATLDTDPFAISSVGKPNSVNVAAGTEFLAAQPLVTLEYEPDMSDGVHPLVLAQNEGFLIQNGLVWPAAGTGIVKIEVQWLELEIAKW